MLDGAAGDLFQFLFRAGEFVMDLRLGGPDYRKPL